MTFSGAGRFIVTVHSLTAWQMTHTAGHGPLLLFCYELIYTSCLSGFPISSSESLAVPRYGCVFFLDLKKPSSAICIVNFVTAPNTRHAKGRASGLSPKLIWYLHFAHLPSALIASAIRIQRYSSPQIDGSVACFR